MTAEMGPADTDSSQPWPMEWLGVRSVSGFAGILNLFAKYSDGDVRVKVSPDRREISLHGESEHTGDRFARGYLTGIIEGMTAVTAVYLGLLFLTAGFRTPLAAVSGVVSLFFFTAAYASILSLSEFTLIDLTTEKPDDGLDELAERYLEGEFDEREFEERADEVAARE